MPGRAKPAWASPAAIRSAGRARGCGWFHATHRLRSAGPRAFHSIFLWIGGPREASCSRKSRCSGLYRAVAAVVGVAAAAAFARDVITQAAPQGRERAKNLLWAAGKLADFAYRAGP